MSGTWPIFLVTFRTSLCDVRNMAKNFGHVPDITGTVPDIIGHVPDITGTVTDITGSVPDIPGTVPDIFFNKN